MKTAKKQTNKRAPKKPTDQDEPTSQQLAEMLNALSKDTSPRGKMLKYRLDKAMADLFGDVPVYTRGEDGTMKPAGTIASRLGPPPLYVEAKDKT